ncbi:MAG TPA: CHAT domain-containing protein, partial [Leptolyngbyaceae cyanobacterium M65_K2018_010]|nr:CHAT domain-containing protein [Leptolyngbyaceae cyanobacterium M65_K2018_010]
RLGFKDSRLQRLPWELLYGDDRPLATGMDVTLCRYYQAQTGTADLAAMPPLASASTPLRALVVISAPDDQERLALSREIQHLMADLQSPSVGPGNSGLPSLPQGSRSPALTIELTILEQPGRAELVQALEQGHYQVLHYAGHSDVSETGGDLFLVNRQTGLTEWLSGKELAGLLVNNGIWLAVFNSCRGAYTPTDDSQSLWREQNLLQALVNRGVPGVIAMAERIPDDVAITFTQLLYRNLRQGYPIDVCLSRVRQGLMSAHRSNQPLWMLPLLYLRPGFDGYLYTPAASLTAGERLEPLALALEQALLPPDYSSDPEISGLAQEVFAGHAASSRATLAMAAPVGLASPSAPQPPLTTTALPGIPEGLEEIDAEAIEQPEGDTAPAEGITLSDLVEQLSAPAGASGPQSVGSPLPGSLLSQWEATGQTTLRPLATMPAGATPVDSRLNSPPATSVYGAAPPASTPAKVQVPGTTASASTSPTHPTRSPLPKEIWWVGAGLAGLAAALGMAIALVMRQPPTAPPSLPPTPSPAQEAGGDLGSPLGSMAAGRDSVAMVNAIQALTTDNLAMARKFIEQLLDQNDLTAAQSVIAAANPEQLLNPDLAFARGRLAWQQATVGLTGASPNDALRAWFQALEGRDNFLEAWVALGFAQYLLGDTDQAIKAWEKALDLDQKQLRDRDPEGQQRVSSAFTLNAIAGLAMALQKQSEQSLEDTASQALQAQAQSYLTLVVGLDPAILNPNTLALRWLWTPQLIENWQTAYERLSLTAPTPAASE